MSPLRLVAALALVTGCYRQDSSAYETLPEPTTVAGPPGGEMDPAWSADYPVEDPSQYAASGELGYVEPSSDPVDAGYVMGTVTQQEIDVALEGYGEWIWVEDYGYVWRPYATAVGVDFTPYESCGTWVWTDWGWTFACDWDWGWLPFHYGRWGWYDDYWAWQPGTEWSPAWVEWRGGGGYVGWRPLGPQIRDHRTGSGHRGPRVRDHRTGGGHRGPIVRDHRTGSGPTIRDHRKHKSMDSHWRFAANTDFGKRIRPHLVKEPAKGLQLTSIVTRPPIKPTYQPVHAASIMRGRLSTAAAIRGRGTRSPATPGAPATSGPRRTWNDRGAMQPVTGVGDRSPGRSRDGRTSPGSPSIYQPTYPTYQPPTRPQRPGSVAPPSYDRYPDRTATPSQPARPTRPTLDDRPSRPSFDRAPPVTYPPSRPMRPSVDDRPSRPSFDRAPPVTYPPSRPMRPSVDDRPSRPSPPASWSPPSRGPSAATYGPPSRTYSPPARGSSSGSYSPPSRTYSPSRSSGSSYSPPSRSSGSSYSPPSRSSGSSYNPPSRSSGSSYSPPSRSTGGSSRSSGSFGGGARSHRR